MGGMGYDALLRRSVLQTCGCFDSFPSYPICFDILAHSFAPLKMLTPLFSSTTALFGKNNRGWGTPSEKHASVFGRSQRGFFSTVRHDFLLDVESLAFLSCSSVAGCTIP